VAELRTREVEVHRHAEEEEKMASNLSVRVHKDNEEDAQVMRECSNLHQWDVEARQ
jgi:hypothetical protein